jgi:predicted Rossmann fold nucleotide-binding protein DprA/Smf involved in DNA uptake
VESSYIAQIPRDDPRYPSSLVRCLGREAPAAITAIGKPALLERRKLALFCSARCPGSLIVQSYDMVQRLRESPFAMLGGFHSPMEKEWLSVLLRGPAPVILCPARSVETMRLPTMYRRPLQKGRLLILSCFPGGPDRPTTEMAEERNRFVAGLADIILVAYAAQGGKTEQLCREALILGKPLYTLDDKANAHLVDLGAKPISPYKSPGC